MKPSFPFNQAQFYYPGQEIRIKEHSCYNISQTDFKNLEKGRNRLLFVAVFFVFGFMLISARLFEFTVLKKNPEFKSANNTSYSLDIKMTRADITDRNGIVLATSLPTVNLYSDNSKISDPEKAAKALVQTIPSLKYEDVKKRLERKTHFVYLKRNLTPKEKYEVNRLGFPAFNFEKGEKRVYPQGNLFAHIVGAVDIDNNGISGIEKTFDEELINKSEPLKLSVDVGVQDSVRSILAKSLKHYNAIGATAIVIDVNSSEIVSMVSLPDYDPNNFKSTDYNSLFNRATLGVYESGSVFKIFNTAMALENGKLKLSDKIDSSPLVLANYTIKDLHPQNRPLTPKEIMVHSSNTASARIAMALGADKQKAFLAKVGLLRPLNIELPEKSKPLVPQKWRESTIANVSFGYGVAVTPLHVVNAVAAIVNGGIYRPASLLASRNNELPPGTRVITEKNSKIMRQLLRAVVTEGTGRNSQVSGYDVGGKTGSAERLGKDGKYIKGSLRTSFVAVFPTEKPKYALLVMLDAPQKTKETFGFNTAGWNVVPTAKNIIETIAPQLGVLPNFKENENKSFIAAALKN